MKIDGYMKLVMTIIALCLIWICVKDNRLSSTVHAQSPVQEVVIVGIKGDLYQRALPVSIQDIFVANPFSSSREKGGGLPIYGEVKTRNYP